MADLFGTGKFGFGRQVNTSEFNILLALVLFVWTVAVVFLLFFVLRQMDQSLIESARIHARTATELDVYYRRWNTMHGGVYVPVSESLAPNPFLKVPDRDVETKEGLKLTKINPAFMNRQVYELGESEGVLIASITSLTPLRPENKADKWESVALQKLKNGAEEFSSVETIDGKEFFRIMVPLTTEEQCLKCHAAQGHKVGDVYGGITVAIPLDPLFMSSVSEQRAVTGLAVIAWLLGCMVIVSHIRIKRDSMMIKASESNYRLLVETMSEGIVILDNENRVVFCNSPFSHMLGYDADVMQGRPFNDYLNTDSSDEYSHYAEDVVGGRQESFELNLVRRNGKLVTVLFSPRTLITDRQEPQGIIAVATDISGLKKMEKEMFRRQRLISVGMLAGGVAHEIGSPLQCLKANTAFLRRVYERIRGFVQNQNLFESIDADSTKITGMSSESTLKTADLDKALREIPAVISESENSISRIENIAASIKDLAGTGSVRPEPEDINELIRQCIEITRNSWFPVAGVRTDLASNIPGVKCVARDINQVLITVIMNAVDAISTMRARRGVRDKGIIRIATGRIGKEVRIVVSDNGIGIEEEDLDKIFEPFFTTKSPGKGTGQGLAVALRIMHEHDGNITAENLSGKGAVFVLTLPVDL